MDSHRLAIIFPGSTTAEAGRLAEELRMSVDSLARARALAEPASFELQRARDDTQDMGSTLIVLLGTPAAAILAKSVHDLVARLGNRVSITTPNGIVVAIGDGAANMDVAATTAALLQGMRTAAGG